MKKDAIIKAENDARRHHKAAETRDWIYISQRNRNAHPADMGQRFDNSLKAIREDNKTVR
jgi:hypothetical protein